MNQHVNLLPLCALALSLPFPQQQQLIMSVGAKVHLFIPKICALSMLPNPSVPPKREKKAAHGTQKKRLPAIENSRQKR